ncbi:MAG: two-component system response regulator [Candidatus Goldiibacteriota bacterium HGW-Goldbacteria-1]|jgi:DNA-binding response OmpR family regulator|nr:MAG: two-component system response regulator [Candidatus Goldiibacteriota bacterium HGW-Goldbacteria-1]
MSEKLRIMVVDDEPDIVKIVKISFELANYEVIECNSGEECLEKLKTEKKPDIILLDIMMPGLSGYETCVEIRKNPLFKGTKIVMLTAKGQKGDAEEGLQSGADDYIIKPFDPYELIEQVKEILDRK